MKIIEKINQITKSSKTAWNPTVHVNNIDNFVLTDLVNGNILWLEAKAAGAFSDAAKGKRSKSIRISTNTWCI